MNERHASSRSSTKPSAGTRTIPIRTSAEGEHGDLDDVGDVLGKASKEGALVAVQMLMRPLAEQAKTVVRSVAKHQGPADRLTEGQTEAETGVNWSWAATANAASRVVP